MFYIENTNNPSSISEMYGSFVNLFQKVRFYCFAYGGQCDLEDGTGTLRDPVLNPIIRNSGL